MTVTEAVELAIHRHLRQAGEETPADIAARVAFRLTRYPDAFQVLNSGTGRMRLFLERAEAERFAKKWNGELFPLYSWER